MIDLSMPPPAPAEIRHECVVAAAAYYNIPPEIIVSIRIHEGGQVGKEMRHPNGAVDIGPMQVNQQHVGLFARYGLDRATLKNSECLNVFAGAFLLFREVVRAPDYWTAIGNYHSRTPKFHQAYRARVAATYKRISERYPQYFPWLRKSAEELRQAYVQKGIVSSSNRK